MKVNKQALKENLDVIEQLLNYSFEDIRNYSELTDREKGIISEDMFDKLFGDSPVNSASENIFEKSAEQLLKDSIKVYCHNRNEWEKDDLTMLSSGDFVDSKMRLHKRLTHTPYVTYEDALRALNLAKIK